MTRRFRLEGDPLVVDGGELRRPSSAATLLVVVASVAVCLSHALQRTGFLLDDWFSLGNARFKHDFLAPGSGTGTARPLGVFEYSATFRGFGRHPLLYVLLLGALGLLTAVVLLHLLVRILPPGMALAAVLLWVVMPNHQSLEVWASGSIIAFSLLFACLGVLAVARPEPTSRQLLIGAGFLLAGIWSYEACAPVAIVAFCMASVLVGGRLQRRQVIVGLGVGVFCLAWILAHWNPGKHVGHSMSNISQLVPANFGYGIAPTGPVAALMLAGFGAGMAFTVWTLALPRRRCHAGPGEWSVMAGVVILGLSVLPFAYYVYSPVGIGDRANVTAAVGGALVWVGLLSMLFRLDSKHLVLSGIAVVVVAAMLFVRVRDTHTYAVAFADADRILAAARTQIPDPHGPIVFGPAPVQRRNIAAFLDQSNVNHAVKVEYGRADVEGRIAYSRSDFSHVPRSRRLDIWRLSRLVPDVDLSVDGQGLPRTAGGR